jgi:holo-[acyl-carrier protein] synthase
MLNQIKKYFAPRRALHAIGNDLVFIPEIESSHQKFGDRYLNFIFTPKELSDCSQAEDTLSYSSLAARIAVKESVMKILKPSKEDLLPWRSIEILRDAFGSASVKLHDYAADMARQRKIKSISVTMTHEHQYASALVLAIIS